MCRGSPKDGEWRRRGGGVGGTGRETGWWKMKVYSGKERSVDAGSVREMGKKTGVEDKNPVEK